jgi:PAS domain S-box-containing protein
MGAQIAFNTVLHDSSTQKAAIDSAFIESKQLELNFNEIIDRWRNSVNAIVKSKYFAEYLKTGDIEQLSGIFKAIAETNENIFQLRVINSTGLEMIRFNRNQPYGEIKRVPESALQNKSDRYYVATGLEHPAGDIRYSDIDLNIEQGVIEQPIRETLRITYPFFTETGEKQLVVVNFDADFLLQPFLTSSLTDYVLGDVDTNVLVRSDGSPGWSKHFQSSQDLLSYVDGDRAILANEIYQSQNFVSRLLKTPLPTPLVLVASIKPQYLDNERDLLIDKLMFETAVVGSMFILLSFGLVQLFNRVNLTLADRTSELEAVRQSQQLKERFESVFNDVSSGIVIYEAVDDGSDFVFSDINPYVTKIDGVSKEDVVGIRVSRVFPSIRESGLLGVLTRVYQTGHSETVDIHYKDEVIDGWRSNHVSRLENRDLVVIYDDITQEKLSQQLIENKTNQLKLATEAAQLGVWFWDLKTDELLWDHRMREIYQVPDEIAQQGMFYEYWQKKCHPDDLQTNEKALQSAIASGTTYNSRFRIIVNDEIRHIEASAVIETDDSGEPSKMVGVNRDITEEILLNQSLAQERANLALMTESIVDYAIINLDINGLIVSWNKGAENIKGYSAEEVIGKSHSIFYTQTDIENHEPEKMLDVAVSDGSMISEGVRVRKDGTTFEAHVSLTAVYDHTGALIGFTKITRDITIQKNAERFLVEAKMKASEANHAKSEFLANMSHEIRTPMNGIVGMASLLQSTSLDNEQKRLLSILGRSAESLIIVINDILDFSKIEAGQLELEVIDFELGTLLSDFAASMSFRSDDKELDFACPTKPIIDQWYKGDPTRLKQILTNLVGNAFKFTPKGSVLVDVFTDEKGLLRFEVTDTGIGIEAANVDKLFDRFTQEDSSTTRRFGGTGLGLAICKQLVTMMGGQIGVRSAIGKGSTFWFTLDLPSVIKAPTQAFSNEDLKKQKLLVVDDNRINLDYLTNLLKIWGIDYVETDKATDAIVLLKQAINDGDPFSIAIFDMKMPGMSGINIQERIKEHQELSHLKTILLTSVANLGHAKKALKKGFSAYMTKPFNPNEIFDVLLQVTGTARQSNKIVTRFTALENLSFNAKLLIAEDNKVNQLVATKALEKLGIQSDIANDGNEAIELLSRNEYDLVLMDVNMPNLDGLDATIKIRSSVSEKFNKDIPIVALTADAMQGDREKCIEAGMNDYVTKPINFSQLKRVLSKWLPEHCHIVSSDINP